MPPRQKHQDNDEPAPPESPARRVLISEGLRSDLEQYGQAIDPATGLLLTRDKDTGKVTVTDRKTGEVTDLA